VAEQSSSWTWPESLYAAISEGLRGDALAVCVAHHGAHAYYGGGCVALGRPRPIVRHRCVYDSECTLPEYLRHTHQERITVTLDPDELARAIVEAAAATRAQRAQTVPSKVANVPALSRPTDEQRARYARPVPPPVSEEEREQSGGFAP
jgi:hypothetical protein